MKLSENNVDYHQKYGGILGCHRRCLFINRNNNKHYNTKRINRIMNITVFIPQSKEQESAVQSQTRQIKG